MRDRKSFENRILTKDPKTILAYRITLDSFEKFLKNNNYEITPDNAEDIVQEYVNWFSIEAKNHRRGTKGHSPNTVWAYYSRVKKYLKHLKIHIDDIELPSKTKKDLHPLKLSEIHDIFKELSYKDVTLFLTQIQTGMRIGETVGLRKKHFVTEHERLIIKIPTTIAKFHKARTVVVGKEADARIRKMLQKIDDDQLVFGTHDNMEYSKSNKIQILRHAIERTDLDMKYEDTGANMINSHSFRAYFITKVSRHDPNIAKKLAGEQGYLLQYDRLTDEEFLEEYLKFENDLAIFDLSRKDNAVTQKQMELEERLAKQEKQMKELFDYAFKKIERE